MNTIPLLQFPLGAYLRVLRWMGVSDQLVYSLCSRNTKKAIISLNLKTQRIEFSVGEFIYITIENMDYISFSTVFKLENNFPNNQFIAREGTEVFERGPLWVKRECNFGKFELKEWIDHFCEVLHHSKIDELRFSNENNFNYIEPVQKAIKGIQIGCLVQNGGLSKDFAKNVLESFPSYEKLSVIQLPYDGHEQNKVLIQNLKSFCIRIGEEFKLNELLLSNSERIVVYSSLFTEKDFNGFLKMWISGSNPRLKDIFMFGKLQLGKNSFDKNDILKGIEYNQIPLDSNEVYRDYINETEYRERKLAGGFRVGRPDATTAVIKIKQNIFWFIVE
ncbi:unnamed protein product [Caenorhabditis brenneri]